MSSGLVKKLTKTSLKIKFLYSTWTNPLVGSELFSKTRKIMKCDGFHSVPIRAVVSRSTSRSQYTGETWMKCSEKFNFAKEDDMTFRRVSKNVFSRATYISMPMDYIRIWPEKLKEVMVSQNSNNGLIAEGNHNKVSFDAFFYSFTDKAADMLRSAATVIWPLYAIFLKASNGKDSDQ